MTNSEGWRESAVMMSSAVPVSEELALGVAAHNRVGSRPLEARRLKANDHFRRIFGLTLAPAACRSWLVVLYPGGQGLIPTRVGTSTHGFRPPPHRDPSRRYGRLLASDGYG
jgi:hypothetical protein